MNQVTQLSVEGVGDSQVRQLSVEEVGESQVSQSSIEGVGDTQVSQKLSQTPLNNQKNVGINNEGVDSSSDESFHDSFLSEFPGQIPNSPKNTDNSKLSEILDSDGDDSLGSSQTSSKFSTSFQNSLKEREKTLLNTIRSLAKKLQDENQEKTNLKNIIEGQEKEIISLQRDNFKIELELDEAETVIANTDLELKNTKTKLKFTEELLMESKNAIFPLNLGEIFKHQPHEIFELYVKELNQSKTKTSQIKTLLGEIKLHKKNFSDLKKENDDLRLKVVNLKEEDIDKKILNYTIEENRRLEYKIKIQKERHIRLGTEFKDEMEVFAQTEEENKKLKEKILNLEKKVNDESLILAGNILDDGWETTSERSIEPEDQPFSSSNTVNIVQPDKEKSVEKLLKLLLKKIEGRKTETNPKKPNKEIPKQPEKTENSESRANTSPHVSKKQICRFHLQQRCIFGARCRNFHPENRPNGNFPPWNQNMYPNLNSQNQTRTSISPGLNQTQRTGPYLTGRQSGYWSQPQPPIPLNTTRFSYLPAEVNLNMDNFPMLSN